MLDAGPFSPRLRAAALALGAAGLLAAPAGAASDDAEVVLIQPTKVQPLVGPVDVAFLIAGAEAEEVLRAEIFLDGARVGVVDAPPWRATIDAGDELGERFLEIQVTLTDGGVLRTELKSRPIRFHEVEVRLVNLAVTVKDRRGKPIKGLTRDDFQVLDEGAPVPIERWDPAPAGLAVALVLDTSLTMRGKKTEAAREAAEDFVRALESTDRVAILSFDEELDVAQELTGELDDAVDALGRLSAGGGTALYDAVYEASSLLREVPAGFRRVAIVLSDGRDESASGLEPGSFYELEEAVRKAHQHDVVVYTIGLGAELENQYDFTRRMTTAEVLERIARSTGGLYHKPRRSSVLGRSYREILDELRQQYSIAYTPPPPRPGETWRSVEVRVKADGADVRTREGYYVD